MKPEDAARVLSGGSANPDDDINEGLVDNPGEEVVIGASGEEERRTYVAEPEYSQEKREAIASSAAELDEEPLSTYVRGGLKLKPEYDLDRQPSEPKSEDEIIKEAALGAWALRHQQAKQTQHALDDHRLANAALSQIEEASRAWGEGTLSEEQAAEIHAKALQEIEAVDADELRHTTYERASDLVAPDLYEGHVGQLQRAYVEHEAEQAQERAEAHAAQIEEDTKIMDAVFRLEEQRINALPPIAQHICREMLAEQGESIAQMDTKEIFTALAYARNAAKLAADEIEAGEIEAATIRAWPGGLRPNAGLGDLSRRERRDWSAHLLGVARDPWSDDLGRKAMARAEAEVKRDIKSAVRTRGGGRTGKETVAEARRQVAKLTGTPIIHG